MAHAVDAELRRACGKVEGAATRTTEQRRGIRVHVWVCAGRSLLPCSEAQRGEVTGELPHECRLRAKQSKTGEAAALCTGSSGGGRTRRTKDKNGKLKEGIGSKERFVPIGCTRATRRDRNTRQRRGPTWERSGSTEMDETGHNQQRRTGGEVRLLTLRGLAESFELGDARGRRI